MEANLIGSRFSAMTHDQAWVLSMLECDFERSGVRDRYEFSGTMPDAPITGSLCPVGPASIHEKRLPDSERHPVDLRSGCIYLIESIQEFQDRAVSKLTETGGIIPQ